MFMTLRRKTQSSAMAVLPMEYLPRIPYASDDKHARHYLIPGKVFAASHPFAISTIVGSSVVLCLWDSECHIGGASHFLLPEGPEEHATRYANVANPALLQRMLELSAGHKTLEAKIFGGSQTSVTFGNSGDSVGERNVHATTSFLTTNNIRLIQREVGGTHGRKLVFHTDDGLTWWEEL
jgi:chemotaxis protein CheD